MNDNHTSEPTDNEMLVGMLMQDCLRIKEMILRAMKQGIIEQKDAELMAHNLLWARDSLVTWNALNTARGIYK